MLTHIFEGGERSDNYGPSTLVNNTQLIRDITIPAGERWVVYSASITNGDNVSRAISVFIWNSSTQLIDWMALGQALAAGAEMVFPNMVATAGMAQVHPIILEAGDVIKIRFAAGGASAGGTAKSAVISRLVKV